VRVRRSGAAFQRHRAEERDPRKSPRAFGKRIVRNGGNDVRGLNRVVYDITSKPPGSIAWE
jgi:GMP synthase PP-ATPase subunit